MLQVSIKPFKALTLKEIYAILQLRSEVFVVEQDCVYQDIDGKDDRALHLLGFKNDVLIAYARCFKPGDYFQEASIGRVVVQQAQRHFNYGSTIMAHAINTIETHFQTSKIKISAQTYLLKFYNLIGFKAIGKEYLEDGIPHVAMLKAE